MTANVDGVPEKFATLGLTYDDVLLLPGASAVLPNAVDTSSRISRNVRVNIPLLSAAMDKVTESRMAISMARQGGVGVLHRNLSIEDQANQVDLVKRSESGMVANPITIHPDATLGEADALCAKFRISGVPVTDGAGKLLGIVTNRDMAFETDRSRQVREVMTPMPLVTGQVGISGVDAMELLRRHKIEKLPLVDGDGILKGLITVKDFVKAEQYPHAAGADTVMLGSLLAGCEESPGELQFINGKQFKSYRGMGSLGAMQSRGQGRSYSKDRYFQAEVASDDKLVPEGIEGQVPYRGPLANVLHQLVGGLRQTMGYVGAATIEEMESKGRFVRITSAGLKESHPHDIQMTVEAPNYSRSK